MTFKQKGTFFSYRDYLDMNNDGHCSITLIGTFIRDCVFVHVKIEKGGDLSNNEYDNVRDLKSEIFSTNVKELHNMTGLSEEEITQFENGRECLENLYDKRMLFYRTINGLTTERQEKI